MTVHPNYFEVKSKNNDLENYYKQQEESEEEQLEEEQQDEQSQMDEQESEINDEEPQNLRRKYQEFLNDENRRNDQIYKQIVSENQYLKEELKEIKHKLDILISQRENDRLIIETLKDSLQSMNRLLEKKESECQRLSQQHESLLLERVNESQRSIESTKTLKENRGISMNLKKGSQQSQQSQQSSQLSIQNIQKDEKILFDELRNFCFKKR